MWEYAPEAWAFLSCTICAQPQAAITQVTALVHLGPAAAIAAPVRLGHVPPGWRLTEFDRFGVSGSGPFFSRADQPYQVSLTFRDGTINQQAGYGIVASPADGIDWHDGWDEFHQDELINGHPVSWEGENMPLAAKTIAEVDFGSCHVQVAAGTHQQAAQIIEGLVVADCTNPATWWDARTIGVPAAPLPTAVSMPVWLPAS